MKGRISKTEDQIRKLKYISKLYLQYCGVCSRLENHHDALNNAKNAYKLSCEALILTLKAIKRHQSSINSKKKKDEQKIIIINRALPSLFAIEMFITKGKLPSGAEMRSALGVRGHPEWVYNFNMSEIMVINPGKTEDFKCGVGIQAEFTKDYILYKISLLALSLYCMGTEMQFMNKIKSGENACNTAIKLMKVFFPEECPLTQHFIENCKQPTDDRLQDIPEYKPKHKKSRRTNSEFIGKFRPQSHREHKSIIPVSASKKILQRPKSALKSVSPEHRSLEKHRNKSFENIYKPKKLISADIVTNPRVHVD